MCCFSCGALWCLRVVRRTSPRPMLTCSTLVRCGVDVSRDRPDTHETMQLEPHQCTHVPGNVPEHLFSTPDITGDKRQAQFISQIPVFLQMLGSFGFRLSLLSARRVQTPFTTTPVWPWRQQLCAHVFGSVSRAKGHDVGHQDDGPVHVSVTEAELSNIARTKECWLPGVHFDCKDRRWRAYITHVSRTLALVCSLFHLGQCMQ